jgi:hypothetical protein
MSKPHLDRQAAQTAEFFQAVAKAAIVERERHAVPADLWDDPTIFWRVSTEAAFGLDVADFAQRAGLSRVKSYDLLKGKFGFATTRIEARARGVGVSAAFMISLNVAAQGEWNRHTIYKVTGELKPSSLPIHLRQYFQPWEKGKYVQIPKANDNRGLEAGLKLPAWCRTAQDGVVWFLWMAERA